MSLGDILITVSLLSVAVWFWQIRANAEIARQWAIQYCQQQRLIFVSLHRNKIGWVGRRFGVVEYTLIFSSDHEITYEGSIYVKQQRIIRTTIPPHRTPE